MLLRNAFGSTALQCSFSQAVECFELFFGGFHSRTSLVAVSQATSV